VGDAYGAEWTKEQFKKNGITYKTSEKSKSAIYVEALPLLNSGKVKLLDHPRLISQICGLERRTARGGKDTIDHAPGGHDDLANAALGVLVNLASKSAPFILSPRALERFAAAPPRDRFAATMVTRNRFARAR
jgi:hypothetical protein